MSLRKFIGYFTSPFFVPLRKLVVWGDRNFGTCDMRLTLEDRPYANNEDKGSLLHIDPSRSSKPPIDLQFCRLSTRPPMYVGNSLKIP